MHVFKLKDIYSTLASVPHSHLQELLGTLGIFHSLSFYRTRKKTNYSFQLTQFKVKHLDFFLLFIRTHDNQNNNLIDCLQIIIYCKNLIIWVT